MAYTYLQLNENRHQLLSGTTFLVLDRSQAGAAGELHGQILDLILNDQSKMDRLGFLLEWNPNFAYPIFCLENNLIIPPPEEPSTPE